MVALRPEDPALNGLPTAIDSFDPEIGVYSKNADWLGVNRNGTECNCTIMKCVCKHFQHHREKFWGKKEHWAYDDFMS